MLDAVAKVFTLRWGFLFCAAASITGLATAVGLFTRRPPLAIIEQLLRWIHWDAATPALAAAAHWTSERSGSLAVGAVIAVLLGIGLTTFDGRGAALSVLGVSLDVQAGGHAALWIFTALGLMTLLAFVLAYFGPRRWFHELDAIDSWCRSACMQILAATFYLVVGRGAWIADAAPRRPSWA